MYEAQVVDTVYIALQNGLHFEIAHYFLECKIPTFCEKLLASNFTEVKQLIEYTQKNQTYLQEGVIPLYNPVWKNTFA